MSHTTTAFTHIPQSPQVWLRFAQLPSCVASDLGQIGFVLHIHRLGRAMAHPTTAFAHMPQPSQVWLRFAPLPSSAAPGRVKLGSFRTIRPEIGFVLHIPLAGRATAHMTTGLAHIPQSPQVWLRFAPLPSSAAPGRVKFGSFRTIRPEIGFVLHNRPPAGHPAPPARAHSGARGPNWVRFARFPLPAASGPGSIGFVLRISASACQRRQGPPQASGPNHQFKGPHVWYCDKWYKKNGSP
jgi:hypothetical protein